MVPEARHPDAKMESITCGVCTCAPRGGTKDDVTPQVALSGGSGSSKIVFDLHPGLGVVFIELELPLTALKYIQSP